MCNCGNTITTSSICTNCVQTDCACPIKDFSTDCILYTGEDLPCTDIKQGTIMTELITQLDTYICTLQTQILNSARLVNIGSGSEVYKGVDGLGRKQIRTIESTDSILTVGISEDDLTIDLSVDHIVLSAFVKDNQLTYSSTNVGTGAQVLRDTSTAGRNSQFNFRKIKSSNSSVSIVEGADDINITVDGSETKVTSGTAISVSGSGTTASPYLVTNNLPDQVVSIIGSGATTITGTYPNFTISSTDSNTPVSITGGGATTVTGTYPNFTVSSTDNNTTYSAGAGLVLSGTTFGVANLQKVITADYTLTSADTEYTIFVNNGTSPVNITVPAGLVANFNAGFIQEGTGLVTFVASGTTINTPSGLKIKGQSYQAFLEKKQTIETFYLLGNVIA